jgi:hypothetical protein
VVLSPEFEASVLPRPREKTVTGGWQSGKSTGGGCDLILPVVESIVIKTIGMPWEDRQRLYWGVLPSYKAPCKEFDYLIDWAAKLGILTKRHQPDNDSWTVELYGGLFKYQTKTGQDLAAIAGEPCDGVLVIEAGQIQDGIYDQVQGRVMTRRGWVDLTGTIEPAELAPRFTWFEKLAQEWKDKKNPDQLHVSLPSWANRTAFPGGEFDPEIERLATVYGGRDSVQFKRRIAGEPVGVSFPIYWQLEGDRVAEDGIHPRGFYDVNPVWMGGRGAGGHDFGTGGAYNHPSTLVACTILNKGIENQNIVVVREAWSSLTLDQNEIEYHRRRLSQKYGIPRDRWGFDPMQGEAAAMAGGKTTGGPGSRPEKVGMIEARLNRGTLLFDPEGPGVFSGLGPDGRDGLYPQMKRVHWIKRVIAGRGEVYDYNRDDDDIVAALEDAIKIIDGEQGFSFRPGKLPGLSVKKAAPKILKRLF